MLSSRLLPLLTSSRSLQLRTLAAAAQHAAAAQPDPGYSRDPWPGTSNTLSSRIYVLGQRKEPELTIPEALRALRAYSICESVETVDINITVDMTIKKGKYREPFKGPLVYPHKFGRERTLLFVLETSLHQAALAAGADIVGGDEIFPELEEETLLFDVCLCSPSFVDKFKPFQRKLKSKMPNIRRGTVVPEDGISQAVMKFKTSREFSCDRSGIIRVAVGKLDFPDDHVIDNCSILSEAVLGYHGNLPKASFLQSALLSSTYGPSFPLRPRALLWPHSRHFTRVTS